jgi:hypothetical protein
MEIMMMIMANINVLRNGENDDYLGDWLDPTPYLLKKKLVYGVLNIFIVEETVGGNGGINDECFDGAGGDIVGGSYGESCVDFE